MAGQSAFTTYLSPRQSSAEFPSHQSWSLRGQPAGLCRQGEARQRYDLKGRRARPLLTTVQSALPLSERCCTNASSAQMRRCHSFIVSHGSRISPRLPSGRSAARVMLLGQVHQLLPPREREAAAEPAEPCALPIPDNPRWNSRVKPPCLANSGAAPAPAVIPVMLTVDSRAVLVVGANRAAAVVSAAGTAAMAIAGVSFGVTVFGISGIAAHSGSQGSRPSACCNFENTRSSIRSKFSS